MATNGMDDGTLAQELDSYAREWYDMMITIWRDKLDIFGVHVSGKLKSKVNKGSYINNDAGLMMDFTFLRYGIYVDTGVGNGYSRDQNGEIKLLDPYYRYTHKLGKPREKKPWFSVSWYISREVIKDRAAQIAGETFVGLFDNLD